MDNNNHIEMDDRYNLIEVTRDDGPSTNSTRQANAIWNPSQDPQQQHSCSCPSGVPSWVDSIDQTNPPQEEASRSRDTGNQQQQHQFAPSYAQLFRGIRYNDPFNPPQEGTTSYCNALRQQAQEVPEDILLNGTGDYTGSLPSFAPEVPQQSQQFHDDLAAQVYGDGDLGRDLGSYFQSQRRQVFMDQIQEFFDEEKRKIADQRSEAMRREDQIHPLTQAMNELRRLMDQVDSLKNRLEETMRQVAEIISQNEPQAPTGQVTRPLRFVYFERRVANWVEHVRRHQDRYEFVGEDNSNVGDFLEGVEEKMRTEAMPDGIYSDKFMDDTVKSFGSVEKAMQGWDEV